jgi:hypothetical protein
MSYENTMNIFNALKQEHAASKEVQAANKVLDAEIKKRVKHYLTNARRHFDSNPSALHWIEMLEWSFMYQQVCSSTESRVVARKVWNPSDMFGFPERFAAARFNQPLCELIRS